MQHPDEGTIHAWADAALAPDEMQRVGAHIDSCDKCAAAAAEARGLIAASTRILAGLDQVASGVEPPRDAGSAGGAASAAAASLPAAARRRGSWLSRWPVRAAAAVLLVAGGTFLVQTAGPPPVETATHRPEAAAAEPDDLQDPAEALETGAAAPQRLPGAAEARREAAAATVENARATRGTAPSRESRAVRTEAAAPAAQMAISDTVTAERRELRQSDAADVAAAGAAFAKQPEADGKREDTVPSASTVRIRGVSAMPSAPGAAAQADPAPVPLSGCYTLAPADAERAGAYVARAQRARAEGARLDEARPAPQGAAAALTGMELWPVTFELLDAAREEGEGRRANVLLGGTVVPEAALWNSDGADSLEIVWWSEDAGAPAPGGAVVRLGRDGSVLTGVARAITLPGVHPADGWSTRVVARPVECQR